MVSLQSSINPEVFQQLTAVHDRHCVSIYMPTSTEARNDIDRIRYKNQLKTAAEKLEGYGLSRQEARALLQDAWEQLEDDRFWRYLMHGFVVFIHGGKTEGFLAPHAFDEYVYVNDHLYLTPLIPLLNRAESGYLLLLSADKIRCYAHEEGGLKPIDRLEQLLPERLEDVAGYDHEQKSLQFRSGQGEAEGGMYHGHGAGSQEEKKTELTKLFRKVNEILNQELTDKSRPLVIACVDYLFPLYREVNTYPNLFPKPIEGNHTLTPVHELNDLLRAQLDEKTDPERDLQKRRYQELLSKNLASYKPEEIVPAALHGRLDTLFVNGKETLWGKYHPETDQVVLADQPSMGNVCLLNMASVKGLLSGTKIYVMSPEEMPEERTAVNAIFRY